MVAVGAEGGDRMRDMQDPLRVRLKFMVLTLLAVKPSHGYELSKTIEDITLGTLKASPGSLYPLLRELSREGLVEEESIIESGRLRKVYRLTEKGWKALASAIEEARVITANIMQLLDVAAQKVKRKTRRECVPPEILEHLERLRRTVESIMETLRERACQKPGEPNA